MSMAPKDLKWCLKVPSVQELASQQLDAVPSRYVRDDLKDSILNVSANQSFGIPLIDMAKLANPESSHIELQNLHAACKDWGVFQLINHGISDDIIRNMKEQVKEFFDLPLNEKERREQKPGSNEGFGHLFIISEDQKLEWNDTFFLKVLPLQNQNFNFWPDNPQKFRETVVTYTESMREVTVSIMKFISNVLEVKDPEFGEIYKEGSYDIRINMYPACPEPERVIGVNPHKDVHAITLLLDCGDIPGLQVLNDGIWVPVQPMHHALVVDLGGITEIMTNGIYKSPVHRAVANKSKERISIVACCNPNPAVSVGPARELIKPGTGSTPLYKTVTLKQYWDCFYNSKPGDPYMDKLKL